MGKENRYTDNLRYFSWEKRTGIQITGDVFLWEKRTGMQITGDISHGKREQVCR